MGCTGAFFFAETGHGSGGGCSQGGSLYYTHLSLAFHLHSCIMAGGTASTAFVIAWDSGGKRGNRL